MFNLGIGSLTSYTGYARRTTTVGFDFDGSWADLNTKRQSWLLKTFQ